MVERTPLRGLLRPLRPNVGSVLSNLAQSNPVFGSAKSSPIWAGLVKLGSRPGF